jgi:hypothetical protein
MLRGAIYGGASDGEQLGELRAGVLATSPQFDEVSLLR